MKPKQHRANDSLTKGGNSKDEKSTKINISFDDQITTEYKIKCITLGIVPKKVKPFKNKKIKAHYVLNEAYVEYDGKSENDKRDENQKDKFHIELIDSQKSINSANETTFDYLLKHNKTDPRLKDTKNRLLSISKSAKSGELYDHTGKKIISRDEALTQIEKLNKELIISQQKHKEAVAKLTTPTETTETTKEKETE